MQLRPPSPATVISFIALVVASAGTAYAATSITNTSQIKNGAVTGSDVKNGTIQGADIKKGSITSDRLNKTLQARLAAGGGATFEAFRKSGPDGQPANVVVKVASLTVPAGAYVVTAKTVMTAFTGTTNLVEALFSGPGSLGGHCKLDTAGDVDESMGNIVTNNRPTPVTLAMQLTRTVGAPSTFDLLCDGGAVWRASDTSIIAQGVGTATRTDASATGS
jgi:hypothetical protein